jgi:hypothetical protein
MKITLKMKKMTTMKVRHQKDKRISMNLLHQLYMTILTTQLKYTLMLKLTSIMNSKLSTNLFRKKKMKLEG